MEDKITNKHCAYVDCLVAKKVYDSCSKKECLEDLPFELDLPTGHIEDYKMLYIEYGKAEIEPYEDEPIFRERDDCYSKMKFVVAVPVWAIVKRHCDKKTFKVEAKPICNGIVQSDNKVRFPISVIVYAPREFVRQGRFEPYVESFVKTGCIKPKCHNEIMLSLGFFLIIKVVSDVELKIPNYGFCDIPAECGEECNPNFCETFYDNNITPFPDFFPESYCDCGCDCD